MRLLSQILQRIIYPALGSVGCFRSCLNADVHVITYHGVLPAGYTTGRHAILDSTLVTAESFRAQLRLLKKPYNVISPDEFLLWLRQKKSLPKRAMLLTCDDGLLNQLSVMVPILQEEGLR